MPERNIEDAPPIGVETWSWGNAEWWTALVGVVVTGIFLIFPELQPKLAEKSHFYRLGFLIVIFLTPYFLRFVWFFGKRFLFLRQKAIFYDTVLGELNKQRIEKERVQEMALKLRQQLYLNRQFVIGRVQFYNDQIYITLLKSKATRKLSIGDKLNVMATDDGTHMGEFEIKEDRTKEYLALNVNYIAPIWAGLVRQAASAGNIETPPPPQCVALFLVEFESEENND